MRLGGPTFDIEEEPQALVTYHQENGFSAAFMREVEDKVKRDEIRAAYEEANILPAELGAYRLNILQTDAARRRENMDEICRRLAYADEVGIRCCVIHGGSYEPEGWGTPNPDNQSGRAFEDTVTAVQTIVDRVQPTQTKLTLEPERYLLPDEPDVYLRLVEAIDRRSFGVHLDPVNIIASPKTFYDSGALLKECFDKLGPHVLSCHTKDVITADRYPYHLIETYTGNGKLDHDVYLTEMAMLDDADVSLMIEHLTAEQLPKARDFLFERAEALDLAFVMPEAANRPDSLS